MRILIADGHAVVRKGVRQILADEFLGLTVGEASNRSETVSAVRNEPWDLVILDLSMPGRGGLETLKELRELRPALRVLIFSVHGEEQYAVRALRAGAAGYLAKSGLSDELVKAVRKITEGGRYVSAALAERLAAEVAAPGGTAPHDTLSDRELQVLCLIASGKSVKEIAAALSLSVSTVSTYRARILEKMKMGSSAALTRYAVEHKLLT
jgi:DNA-binding NarL/FixJ family response regulator